MRSGWVSQEDGQVKTLVCKFCEKFDQVEVPAVALEGQWEGGDEDLDPHWVPVCAKHQEGWHSNHGSDPADPSRDFNWPIPVESRLPTITIERTASP